MYFKVEGDLRTINAFFIVKVLFLLPAILVTFTEFKNTGNVLENFSRYNKIYVNYCTKFSFYCFVSIVSCSRKTSSNFLFMFLFCESFS